MNPIIERYAKHRNTRGPDLAAGLRPIQRPRRGVVRLAGSLRRIGVDPERLGLILLLGIRFVPVVAGLAREVRQAQYARGALYSYRAFAVPLLVRALRTANEIGDALVYVFLDGSITPLLL